MKVAMALVAIITLGVGSAYLTQKPTAPTPVIIKIAEDVSPLEKARCSVFAVLFNTHHRGGTGILVGRQKLENGNYRYRAITAYHVIKDMAKAIAKNKMTASHALTILFQPQFHGKPLRIKVIIEDIDWAIPTHDWASFTFELPHKLHCSSLATKIEFESIKFTDRIYLIGCGDLYAPHVRAGNMGATHNHHLFPNRSSRLWDVNPDRYFKPAMPIWRGDSGGGIFDEDGKLLGIINGFSIQNEWTESFVPHSGVALKAYIILDVAQNSKDFFLVEDYNETK